MSEHGNGNGSGGTEPARRIDRGDKGLPPRATPESALLTCGLIAIAVVLGLIIWGYVYWRINPEFHEPTPKTPDPVPVAQ